MVIVDLSRILEFSYRHAHARKSLSTWKSAVEQAQWDNRQDVLAAFPKAKMIANNRARFEILHNTYRLIVKINYEAQIVQIRFIGTHQEYDRIDPATI